MPTATTDRRSQPKCRKCHHPKSFHGGGSSDCRALGCECLVWVEPSRVTKKSA